jgi:hypothetical protein
MSVPLGPVFESSTPGSASASATTLTAPLAGVSTNGNGIFIAYCVTKNNAAHSCSTGGWSLVNQTNSGASFTCSVWVAAQSAAAPVFTWTGAAAGLAECQYYADPQNTMSTTVTLLGTPGTGTGTTHSSAGGNSTANNIDAIYLDVCAINTALATPAGWTENSDTGNTTAGIRRVYGEKSIATSGTASGAISVTGGNAAWIQFQLQIVGSTPSAGFQVSKEATAAWLEASGLAASKIETGAWLEASGLAAAKIETGAWIESNDFRVSKLEALAWLDYTGVVPRRRQLINC